MSYTRITFCGLNCCRLLTILCKQGVKVESFQREQGQSCLVVPRKQYKQAVALLNERCYNIKQVTHFGNVARLNFIKKHFLLAIAFVLLIVATAVLSNYCCRIVVTGDFDDELVLRELQNLGITKGCNLKNFNVDGAENALANKLNAMYVVITRRASALYVNALAKKTTDAPIDMHSRRDIYATQSGVVIKVLCEQGTAMVREGDFVKEGDVLISGQRQFNDGTTADVYAMGKVTLELTSRGFAEYTGALTQLAPTGNKVTATGVVLFGKLYVKDCPFESYSVESSCEYLYPLNLQVQTVTYLEMAKVTIFATLDECLPFLQQQALQNAKQNCNFNVMRTQYVTTGSGVTAILYGQTEIS